MGPELDRDVGPEDQPAAGRDAGPQSSAGTSRFWRDLQTVPNLLSIFRILGILVAGALYLYGYRKAGIIIGVIAGVTDLLDGWLARKLNQSTDLGAILDRLSDLVMETVAFAFLLHFRLLSPIFFVVYLLREFIVMSARQFVAEQGSTIPSSMAGKFKTDFIAGSFVAFFGIHSGLISDPDTADIVYKIGYSMMVAGLVLSYWSGAQYLHSFTRSYSAAKKL